ncbi:helix-turn-helix domain-containing protein [Kribbella sp. NPDC050459]|uniref:helix-turn-helix domain-containing protein n=1 Tax=Kribbella sp. NPDC050459 TaxID=3155785 RepID=UPI0033C8306E
MTSASPPLVLRPGDQDRLAGILSAEPDQSVRRRAQIILLAAEGMSNNAIVRETGLSHPTVRMWRKRYQREGIAGLNDLPRIGRPVRTSEPSVLMATIAGRTLTADQWSSWTARSLAATMRLSPHTVLRIWRKWSIAGDPIDGIPLDPPLRNTPHSLIGVYLSSSQYCVAFRSDEAPLVETMRSDLGSATGRRSGQGRHRDELAPVLESLVAHGRRTADDWMIAGHSAEFRSFAEDLADLGTRGDIHLLLGGRETQDSLNAVRSASTSAAIRVHKPPRSASWCDAVEAVASAILVRQRHSSPFSAAASFRAAAERKLGAWEANWQPYRWVAHHAPDGDEALA